MKTLQMNSSVYLFRTMKKISSISISLMLIIALTVINTVPSLGQQQKKASPTPTPTTTPIAVKSSPTPTPTAAPTLTDKKTRAKGKSDSEPIEDNLELPPEPKQVAPDYEAPKMSKISTERVGVIEKDQTPLSLGSAIRLALENNSDIDIAQDDVKLAEFDLKTSLGVYDPSLVSESIFKRSVSPVASSFGGGPNGTTTESSFNGNLGIQGLTPFKHGGSYSATFSSIRTTSNDTLASLNPQYQTSLNFQYTQPLFRGRKIDENRKNIEIAKKNLSLTDSQFRQQVVKIVAEVESAYWDLVYGLRNLQVQIDAVKEAKQQVESNKRQVKQGVLAPIDVIAARMQVSTFEQNVYIAQESVTRAENALKMLLLKDRTSSMWSNPLIPITKISLSIPKTNLNESINLALANRSEINQLDISKEINGIDKRFLKDQTKPKIDLTTSYTSTGLAGTEIPSTTTIPGTSSSMLSRNLTGGYFQSLTNLTLQRYPTFQVGIQITIPFKNRVAEAQFGKVLVQETRIKNQRNKTEKLIEADVRNSIQMMRSAEARLKIAAQSRNFAELQYESEQRKLKVGTSTIFLVLQRQTSLISARGSELQAQTDLNKAITVYYQSMGTTLDAAGVIFQDKAPKYTKSDKKEITTLLGRPVHRFKN